MQAACSAVTHNPDGPSQTAKGSPSLHCTGCMHFSHGHVVLTHRLARELAEWQYKCPQSAVRQNATYPVGGTELLRLRHRFRRRPQVGAVAAGVACHLRWRCRERRQQVALHARDSVVDLLCKPCRLRARHLGKQAQLPTLSRGLLQTTRPVVGCNTSQHGITSRLQGSVQHTSVERTKKDGRPVALAARRNRYLAVSLSMKLSIVSSRAPETAASRYRFGKEHVDSLQDPPLNNVACCGSFCCP